MNYELYEKLIKSIEKINPKVLCTSQNDNLIMETTNLRLWISRDEYPSLSLEVLTSTGWEVYIIKEVE